MHSRDLLLLATLPDDHPELAVLSEAFGSSNRSVRPFGRSDTVPRCAFRWSRLGRGAGIAAGPFPQAARRTRRAALGESWLSKPSIPGWRSILSVKRIRRGRPVRKQRRNRVRVGASDASLTALSGVAALADLLDMLDVVGSFDRAIGSIKRRERGATAGEVLVGLAQSQLLGGVALVALDRQRQDLAVSELSAVT